MSRTRIPVRSKAGCRSIQARNSPSFLDNRIKYCCNNFHALKITFANETARICEAMGVDPFAVMDLVCQDHQLNISPAYLKPGFAFGGSCLPKDLRATMYFAKTRDVEWPMHGAIAASNRVHVDHAIDKVMARAAHRFTVATEHRRRGRQASDLLVLGMNDRRMVEDLRGQVRPDQMVVDLAGIPDGRSLRGEYVGLCW